MDEEDITEMTEKLFAHAEDVAELSPTIGDFIENVNKKKPELALGLAVAATLCNAAGEISGFYPLTLLAVCLAGTASFLDPDAAADLDMLNRHMKKINQKLTALEGKMDLILDHIVEVRYKDGMNDIRTQFKSMEQAPCKRVWAGEFYGNAAHFCAKDFDSLNELYVFVLTTRTMYLHTKVNYINNYESFTTEEKEAQTMSEMQFFNEEMKIIEESMSSICNFYHAVRTLPKTCKFSPAYIPEVLEKQQMKPFKRDHGTVYAEKSGSGYRVIKFTKESVQFGRKLTAKCKDGYTTTHLVGGPTRVETSEKVMIGHMNENGQWEGGRIDLFHNGLGIVYRKYENGEEVKDSLCSYNDYEWVSATGKPLRKSSSFANVKRPKTKLKNDKHRRATLPNNNQSIPEENVEKEKKSSFSGVPRDVDTNVATDQFNGVDDDTAKLLNQLGLSDFASRSGTNVTVTRKTTSNNLPTFTTMNSRSVVDAPRTITGGRTINIQGDHMSYQQQSSSFTSTSAQEGTKIVVDGRTINIGGLQGGRTEHHVTEEVGEDGTIRRKVNITIQRQN